MLGFKLSYSMNLDYYDQRPPSGNVSLDFEISTPTNREESKKLGSEVSLGQIFTYDMAVTNTKNDKGLLMVVAVFRVPSCLEVNFAELDQLLQNKIIDHYDVTNSNTEINLYWRQFQPSERKEVALNLVQTFAGEQCYQEPSNAFVYYNQDQPIYYYWY